MNYPLNVKNDITSTSIMTGINVKSDNETRLAAAETAIAGKAAASHTHILSEISDYVAPSAYDDSNCAKKNAANIFTAGQSITLTADSIWNESLNMYDANLMAGHNNIFRIGKAKSDRNEAYLGFQWNANSSDTNFFMVGFHSKENLYKFYPNHADFTKQLTLNTNADYQLDITDTRHTTWMRPIRALNPNMTAGQHTIFVLGKENSKGNLGFLHFTWQGADNVNNCVGLALGNYNDLLNVYRDRTVIANKLEVPGAILQLKSTLATGSSITNSIGKDNTYRGYIAYNQNSDTYGNLEVGLASGTNMVFKQDEILTYSNVRVTNNAKITSSKYESTSTDPSDCIGNNLKEAIVNLVFKEVYPIGSVYITSVEPDNINWDNQNRVCTMVLHGCTFTLLPANTFIKNMDWYAFNVGSGYQLGANENPLDTGGEATHTLTENEIPSHTDTFTGTEQTGQFGVLVSANGGTNPSGIVSRVATASDTRKYGSGSFNPGNYTFKISVTPSGTNDNTGGGLAHNNLPPYQSYWIWRRTA